jgi:hypothetical protein
MNPFMSEQLARAKAADWARVAEQRRLANLATRHDRPGQQPPMFGSPRLAGRVLSWADQMRTIRQALVSGAIRRAADAGERPDEDVACAGVSEAEPRSGRG